MAGQQDFHSQDGNRGYSPTPPLGSRSCLAIAKQASGRLGRRFPWIPADDLYSYALFGLVRSAALYQPDRQVPFAAFAARKCMYVAIDEMRRDGIVRRGDRPGGPRFKSLEAASASAGEQWRQLCDPGASRDTRRMEAREWCAAMLTQLPHRDRQILMLRYSDELTFREIGEALDLSESAVCVRHTAALQRLRRAANLGPTGSGGTREGLA